MENAFFAGDWPAGPTWRFAAAAGGKGRGRGRGRRRHYEDRMWGSPPFGGPFFGPPRGRGRRRRGDVRLALLLLLAEEPRNGYQLMQVIEERSDGHWRPSPGSVYPVLSQLEDEGLVRAAEREGAKVFELTEAGHQQVAEAKDAAPPWEIEDDDGLAGRREMRRLVGEVAAAAMQVNHLGSEQQAGKAVETLKHARRELYTILAEDETEDV
jgi:DNA-binding PadR family transcriptional regulator